MPRIYTWQFAVRSYDLDADGHVRVAGLHHYLEEGATQASADAGYTYDWYFENRHSWVIRSIQARYYRPLRYGDIVELRTWVSDVRRIYSHREYDLRLATDGSPVLRGRAKWVYVNLDTLRPVRIPDEAEQAFQPTGILDPLHIPLRSGQEVAAGGGSQTPHRVQHFEIDPAGHVNNANYLNWFEQAVVDYTAAQGVTETLRASGLVLRPVAHAVEYIQGAVADMAVHVETRVAEVSRTRVAWRSEVRDAASNDLIAQDYAVRVCLDAETGRPQALPDHLRRTLVDGPGVA